MDQAKRGGTGLLVLFWMMYMTFIFISQKLNLGVGYHIWPQGEERIWLGLAQENAGPEMVKGFWHLDNRNPLAPWFWYIVREIILNSKWGFYYLSLAINPVLATSIFLLLNRLGKTKITLFSFSVAVLTLSWNFCYRFDNAAWASYIAFICTIFCLYFYCGFVDSKKTNGNQLALALLCYFVSICTYSLYFSGFIGVFLIGLFRSGGTFRKKLMTTIRDSIFFFMIFCWFNCFWYTTSLASGVSILQLTSGTIILVFKSIYQFLLPSSLLVYLNYLFRDWSKFSIILYGLIVFVCYLIFLFNPIIGKIPLLKNRSIFGWAAIVLFTIALPVVFAESMTSVYQPGDRSHFLQAVFQPLLYFSIIFFVFSYLKKPFDVFLIKLCIALFGTYALLISFYYNSVLLKKTYYQMRFSELIQEMHIPLGRKKNILVKNINPLNPYISTEPLMKYYGLTVFHQKDMVLRILTRQEPPQNDYYRIRWKPTFSNDGVQNVGLFEDDSKLFSYSNILIVTFDGEKIEIPKVVDKNFFNGFQVSWNRNEPIIQSI